MFNLGSGSGHPTSYGYRTRTYKWHKNIPLTPSHEGDISTGKEQMNTMI
jgi:hypothetical protein